MSLNYGFENSRYNRLITIDVFETHKNLVLAAKEMAPALCDWVGIYYLDSYLNPTNKDRESGLNETQAQANNPSGDQLLVLGPFIGAVTEHTEIPVGRGICGLAMREQKIINIDDVSEHNEYLACSVETKSEIVIPIYSGNKLVAQLDIDSHSKKAFTPELEKKLVNIVKKAIF